MEKSEPRRSHRRFRRLKLSATVLGLTLAVGVSSLVAVLLYLRIAGERSVLSRVEWEEVRQNLLRVARREASSPADLPVEELPAEKLPPPDLVEIPETRGRKPRPPDNPELAAYQWEAFRADRAKSVVELQPFRSTVAMDVAGAGGMKGKATLVNLNPTVNSWYLLLVQWADGREGAYHLVNAHPASQDIVLDPGNPRGISIVDNQSKRACDLLSDEARPTLELAATSTSPYVSLCGDEVVLRLKTPGRRTTLEWATDFLRDNVWGGEKITVFVRQSFFQDAYLNTSDLVLGAAASPTVAEGPEAPRSASLAAEFASALLRPEELGIALEGTVAGQVAPGRWHRVRFHPGVFASVVRPNLLDPEVFRTQREVVSQLDDVEREALVYLLAFDLDRFDLGFALGTAHPRVGWSERVPENLCAPTLPGPDGIGDIAPLVATGIVPRSFADTTIATFTGGFKRDHCACRVSELATRNHGSHYGFIESGAILSKLQPGLATLFVLDDGEVRFATWTEEDDALLPRIRFARQNGLPIIETDPATGSPMAGARVSHWAAGNWSGSQDKKFRTVRAGAALQESDDKRFFIYAYFSTATPSAMARVFQAYGCRYAMLLDMNALEHTYLAMYHAEASNLQIQHLVQGMEVLDKTVDDQVLPRFLGFADNRDFFYVTLKENVSDEE